MSPVSPSKSIQTRTGRRAMRRCAVSAVFAKTGALGIKRLLTGAKGGGGLGMKAEGDLYAGM